MLTGHLDEVEHGFVAGWAADTEAPSTAQEVLLYVNGQRWAHVRCDQTRADLRDLGLTEGTHGFRFEFASPLPADSEQRISVRFAGNGGLLPNGKRVLPGQRPVEGLTPILVTAPGRSGTTLLMNRLRHSNQVVVAGARPFEVRLLSYYATAYHVLTHRADFIRSMHPDYLEGTGFQVGFNPFSHPSYLEAFNQPNRVTELFQGYMADELLPTFRQVVTEYYLRLKEDQRKPCATFFAEKTNNLNRASREFPRKLFGAVKEIVLVRDPRDLYCSHMAYFHADHETALEAVRDASAELAQIAANARHDTVFFRYRDLLAGNEQAMQKLAQFLDVEIPASYKEMDAQWFTDHATSATPDASVDRWRRELSRETVAEIEEKCWRLMLRFGFGPGF